MIKIGDNATYRSRSGVEYPAIITAIPTEGQGNHGENELTISLEFRNNRGKLIYKDRVLHKSWSSLKTCVWFMPN